VLGIEGRDLGAERRLRRLGAEELPRDLVEVGRCVAQNSSNRAVSNRSSAIAA